jgi:hypothetical protein
MNMNPWLLERMADYERDRVQRDMKQIRLEEELPARRIEEKTTLAHLYRPSLLMLIVCALVRLRSLQAHTRKAMRLTGSTRPCRG